MTAIFVDSHHRDRDRQNHLYQGDLYVYAPTPTTLRFCEFARSLIAEAFSGLDPETAQHHLPVREYAERLIAWKPRFIHHPESKNYLQAIVVERGFDASETYFEVPKMRSSTSDGYLTAGIAYAWHPHRDTWYS